MHNEQPGHDDLTMVRRFAAWLSVFDPRTEVPPKRLFNARHRRKKPYIFSDQEIERLMAKAAQLPSQKGLRALTHVTLIGLLAATGLRPGEALTLDHAGCRSARRYPRDPAHKVREVPLRPHQGLDPCSPCVLC